MNAAERAWLNYAVELSFSHHPSGGRTRDGGLARPMHNGGHSAPPAASSTAGHADGGSQLNSHKERARERHRLYLERRREVQRTEAQRPRKADEAAAQASPREERHQRQSHNSQHAMASRQSRRSRETDGSDDDVQPRTARRTRTDASQKQSSNAATALSSSTDAGLSAAAESLLPATSVATCVLPLDAKLIELLYCLSPTAADRDGKLRVIEQVRETLQRTGLDIQIYGSLCTGLVIPASDVDCVMMRSSDESIAASLSMSLSNALLNISSASTGSLPQRAARAALSTGIRVAAERMRRHKAFTSVTCIAHAKVPIVKCRHRAEDVKVDLSFEKDGCVSSNYLCELFCEPGNELARPLIVLVKAMVNHAGLDDPSIGGLGSFVISMLVLWFLRDCVRTRYAPELQCSVAVLLVGFLQYYGTEFDFKRQGIDYVQQRTFAKAPANELFIVNPIRPGTNCARAATLFATRVIPHFEKAAQALVPLLDVNASTTIMEQRLLQFFTKSLRGVRDWRDVSREAAQSSHLPQNMWDQATNLYVGGVL